MHIGIIGHIAIDTIVARNFEMTSLGGPPCYAGLAAIRLKSDVTLITKVGNDFPDEYSLWLARNSLNFSGASRSTTDRTTRFRIHLEDDKRLLQLTSRCGDIEPLQLESLNLDGAILSPIAGEIPRSVSERVASLGIPTFLDPQGYLRRFDDKGYCYLTSIALEELPKASIIKVDREEGQLLTGSLDPAEIASRLRTHGFNGVVVTNGSKNVIMSSNKVSAEIQVPKVSVISDTTGLGDILAGSFLASFLKTGDFMWSACVGVAFASIASKGKGIAKVDNVRGWESLAKELRENATRYWFR